jgi:hypothetical protein
MNGSHHGQGFGPKWQKFEDRAPAASQGVAPAAEHVFKKYDTNNDGMLSADEFKALIEDRRRPHK